MSEQEKKDLLFHLKQVGTILDETTEQLLDILKSSQLISLDEQNELVALDNL